MGGGGGGRLYIPVATTLYHHNDFCTKMGSDKNRFYV